MTNSITVSPPKSSEPVIDSGGLISKSWYRFMVDLWRRTGGGVDLISGTATTVVLNSPTGAMMLWQTATAPSGWLICNGAAVSRATYADLFSVIGTTNGAGDGSTTFNLPDFRDRLPIGLGASIATSLGATGGAATRTISQANLPNYSLTVTDAGHTHTFTGAAHNHAITDAGHTHTFTGTAHNHTSPSHTHTSPSHTHTSPAHTHTSPAHSHGPTAGNFVRDNAGTEYVNTGGNKGTVVATTATTAVTINSTAATINGTAATIDNATATGTNANSTTGITINNATAGGTNSTSTTGITVASGGSGAALNVMNPTLCVNMIIKI